MVKKITAFVVGVARSQYKEFFKVLLCSYLLVMVAVRFLSIPHKAEVRMVTNIPSAQATSNQSTGAENFTAGGPFSLDRQTFLASQEVLLYSFPLYEAVQKKAEADVSEVMSSDKHVSDYWFEAKRLFQTVLFGSQYTENLGLWKNPAYTRFVNRLSFTPVPQEGTFIVGYTDSDPLTAMRIAGYVTEALIELNVKLAKEESNNVAESLKQRLEIAKVSAEEASQNLSTFLKETNLPSDPGSLRDRYNLYVSALREDDNSTRSKMRSQARLQETERFIKSLEDSVNRAVLTGNDIKVGHLLGELKRVQTAPAPAPAPAPKESTATPDRAVASDNATDQTEPIRQKLANEIARYGTYAPLKDLLELLSKSRLDLARQKQALAEDSKYDEFTREMLGKYEAEIKRYPEFQTRLNVLLSESNQKNSLVNQINQEYLKYSVKSESGVSRVFPIQKPMIVSGFINSGKTAALFSLLLLTSLLVPLAIGGFHYFRKTIFNRLQLSKRSDSIFAGVFPHLPSVEKDQIASSCMTNESIFRFALETSNSLKRLNKFNGKVLAMVGAVSGSGTSVCSYGLSTGLNRLKHSVLVVDCDFLSAADESGRRRPGVARLVNRLSVVGEPESDMETLLARLEMSSIPNEKGGLTFVKLLSGNVDQKIYIEMLKENFEANLQKLKKYFDVILLDGPALSVAEGLMLIEQADGVMLCCPEGKVTEAEVGHSLAVVNQYRKQNSLLFTVLSDSKVPSNAKVVESIASVTLRAVG